MFDSCVLGVDPGVANVGLAVVAHADRKVSLVWAWNRNKVSALEVARATGAVMVVADRAGLPVEEYGPNEVKIAVTGAGNADKDQVRDALVRIHGLRNCPVQADAVDAVAIALTHLMGSRMRVAARTSGPTQVRSGTR
ncbi:MAG: crossover junction endodeoxyribonuclease RuvC [Actinobacteria bacterium]|nr:MAG: crossover junction endodeoxyribonuclease RuvC [Actinomycetota bacterium]